MTKSHSSPVIVKPNTMQEALEQIAIVCTDNMDRDCDHRMALDFVRQVANDCLSRAVARSSSASATVDQMALADWIERNGESHFNLEYGFGHETRREVISAIVSALRAVAKSVPPDDARYWEFRKQVEELVFDPIRRGGRTEGEIIGQLAIMAEEHYADRSNTFTLSSTKCDGGGE